MPTPHAPRQEFRRDVIAAARNGELSIAAIGMLERSRDNLDRMVTPGHSLPREPDAVVSCCRG